MTVLWDMQDLTAIRSSHLRINKEGIVSSSSSQQASISNSASEKQSPNFAAPKTQIGNNQPVNYGGLSSMFQASQIQTNKSHFGTCISVALIALIEFEVRIDEHTEKKQKQLDETSTQVEKEKRSNSEEWEKKMRELNSSHLNTFAELRS
ncbi:MAG: hypothetical protein EZS28_040146, partial [Streblomastix strix]